MDSGIGPSNMIQLFSFLDIPNCKSLNGRLLKNIELIIGPSLIKITIYSMKEAIEEEVSCNAENT